MDPKSHRRITRNRVLTIIILLLVPITILLVNQMTFVRIPVFLITASVLTGITLIILIGGYFYNWKWTGFGVDSYQGKTLWDWLQLLIIPAVLAGSALIFNAQNTQTQFNIAADSQREATLQTYIDHMSELLLDEQLRNSEDRSEIRSVARTRTILTLRQLDGERKALLIQFLYESGLIQNTNTIINLRNTDFRGMPRGPRIDRDETNSVDLSGTDFSGVVFAEANFASTYLRNADFSNAYLSGTDFGSADLRNANFSGANLSGANLSDANLTGANLSGVDLTGASLINTNFHMADFSNADLDNADLTKADITLQQLGSVASHENTIMPDGQTHP